MPGAVALLGVVALSYLTLDRRANFGKTRDTGFQVGLLLQQFQQPACDLLVGLGNLVQSHRVAHHILQAGIAVLQLSVGSGTFIWISIGVPSVPNCRCSSVP